MTTIDLGAIYETAEAAALLHVSIRKLRRLPIACSRITARTSLYIGADLQAFLDATRVGGKARLRRVG